MLRGNTRSNRPVETLLQEYGATAQHLLELLPCLSIMLNAQKSMTPRLPHQNWINLVTHNPQLRNGWLICKQVKKREQSNTKIVVQCCVLPCIYGRCEWPYWSAPLQSNGLVAAWQHHRWLNHRGTRGHNSQTGSAKVLPDSARSPLVQECRRGWRVAFYSKHLYLEEQ